MDPAKPPVALDLGLAFALAALFALLAGGGLGLPASPVMDEAAHATSALSWLAGRGPTEWTHPPLAKLLMALGAWLGGATGDGPGPGNLAALRAPAVAAGALGVAATYALGRIAGGRPAVGVIAALLLAVDGTWLVHARTAMTNAYAVAFITVGAAGVALALRTRPAWLLAAGVAFGLAVATRWSAIPALAIALAVWIGAGALPAPTVPWARRLAWATGGLVALPLALYALAFLPLGYGPGQVVAAQGAMWAHHAAYPVPHPFQSPWWSWPFVALPAWYDFQYDPATQTIRAVWAIGNLAVWWAAVPALAFAAWRAAAMRDAALALVPALGLGLWLVWAVQPRAVTFLHYMLEAIPFACVAIALAVVTLWTRPQPASRALAAVLPAAAVAWLAWFHPLLTAAPVTPEAYAARLWFPEAWEFNAVVNRFRQAHGLEDPEEWRRWRASQGR